MIPISATSQPETGIAYVYFTDEVKPGLLDKSNWTIRVFEFEWEIDNVIAEAGTNRVRIEFSQEGPAAPVPSVDYSATVPDLRRLSDDALAPAFAGFPVTEIP